MVLLFWKTGGDLTDDQRFILYVAVCVFTGIAFPFFTAGTGAVTNRVLGLRLGGGAAIGLAIVVAIDHLVPFEPPETQTEEPPPEEYQVWRFIGRVYSSNQNAVAADPYDGADIEILPTPQMNDGRFTIRVVAEQLDDGWIKFPGLRFKDPSGTFKEEIVELDERDWPDLVPEMTNIGNRAMKILTPTILRERTAVEKSGETGPSATNVNKQGTFHTSEEWVSGVATN